jgi:hypothetical protein
MLHRSPNGGISRLPAIIPFTDTATLARQFANHGFSPPVDVQLTGNARLKVNCQYKLRRIDRQGWARVPSQQSKAGNAKFFTQNRLPSPSIYRPIIRFP